MTGIRNIVRVLRELDVRLIRQINGYELGKKRKPTPVLNSLDYFFLCLRLLKYRNSPNTAMAGIAIDANSGTSSETTLVMS